VEAIFAMQTYSPTNLFMVGVLDLSAAYDSVSMEWPMFGHDPRRTGRYFRGTIYVDDDNTAGPWHGTEEFPHKYIQDGIDDANPLDMIRVSNGTYYENVIADKSVRLIGDDRDSTIIDAGGIGPAITSTAGLVTIRGFTIQNSDGNGICVSSDCNVILRNNIRDNLCGIHIASFEGNRIYHNNFMGNTHNAHDEGYNIWDNGYPSGGNYWDDHSGGDIYCGPGQDVLGSDGIGDAPYIISGGNNQDRYPLMSPWTGSLPIPPRDTVYVDDDFDESTPGWGWIRFDKIQDALDTVVSEGVVYVANGIYYENVRMDKTMDLIGENRDSTIIDGGGSGDVVVFNRIQGTNLTGLTIRNGVYGVHLGYDTFDNAVFDNIVTDNQEVGIFLDFSTSTTVSGNVVTNTDYYGIHLQAAQSNVMSGNTLGANQIGIYSYASSNDNQVYHNDFIDNDQNACDHGDNIWDNGYPSGGNYWSDFDEPSEGAYDENGDGIVDSPYSIPGGSSQDRYPLMHPHNYVMHGDANRDGRISISDVVFLISYLFRDGPAPNPLEAGDANCDEMVNGEDVLHLINYLFKEGQLPGC
jgi:parallel beta-helix repeat protein